MFRIQKLLICEYKDFKETVLVETPFAQVNEYGIGLREVQIALTTTKLLIGNDTFDKNKTQTLSNVCYNSQDPEIETMELIRMLPLELLHIKVFRKGNRQLMKISAGASKVLWFEFGGHILKNMYWNIWRERISAINANQIRTRSILPRSTSSTISITTSEQNIPQPQQIIAEVHRGNSDSSQRIAPTTPILKVTNLLESDNFSPKSCSPSGHFLRQSKCNCDSISEVEGCDQEIVLREVADYFLETQSDIVVGNHAFGYDSCDTSCRDFLFRSASVANFMNSWNTNYDSY